MLTRNEFEVLDSLNANARISQRDIAHEKELSVGSVNAAFKSLVSRGLVSDGVLTQKGEDELAQYKVDNAIILAAGLSRRFAPISYEQPKGLLTVRDEVLIERQIKQLKEAGIEDIAVVVGYKKELFFYLEDKYDVDIVVNEEYATRNNNSSLKVAEGLLGNTYVCSSDDYFIENPFKPYVWKAFLFCAVCRRSNRRMVHGSWSWSAHYRRDHRWRECVVYDRACLFRPRFL